ncbi:hypothetical protein ACS8Y6_04410 [Salinisphaera sp. RV14]|uniref:hypothetical protein n=1 Tax=Salinisphaera sp. RV14 TaxID=3454140 RepID=UPI003F836C97
MNTSDGQIDLQEDFSRQLTVHKSLDQEVIVTTADKVHLCLIKHRDKLTAKREWTLPASICITLVASLTAAQFRDFFLDAAVWKALFIISTIITFIWFCFAVKKAWDNRQSGDIDEIVEALKAHSGNNASNYTKGG